MTRDLDRKAAPLKIEDLARFDGKTFDLDGVVSTDGVGDDKVMIERITPESRVAKLEVLPGCSPVFALSDVKLQQPIVAPHPRDTQCPASGADLRWLRQVHGFRS